MVSQVSRTITQKTGRVTNGVLMKTVSQTNGQMAASSSDSLITVHRQCVTTTDGCICHTHCASVQQSLIGGRGPTGLAIHSAALCMHNRSSLLASWLIEVSSVTNGQGRSMTFVTPRLKQIWPAVNTKHSTCIRDSVERGSPPFFILQSSQDDMQRKYHQTDESGAMKK